jgi:hypothetical protein
MSTPILTKKFSQFTIDSDLNLPDITVGLSSGINSQFIDIWSFLAPGTTAQRPLPSAAIAFRLRFNTSLTAYEFYDSNSATWVQLASNPSEFVWNVVTTTPFQMLADNGYIANSAGLISLILPTLSLVGDEIAVTGQGTGLWRIIQGVNQQIHIGDLSTTVGGSGSITASNQYDSLRLVCINSNLEWTTVGGPQGNLVII